MNNKVKNIRMRAEEILEKLFKKEIRNENKRKYRYLVFENEKFKSSNSNTIAIISSSKHIKKFVKQLFKIDPELLEKNIKKIVLFKYKGYIFLKSSFAKRIKIKGHFSYKDNTFKTYSASLEYDLSRLKLKK
ncbi:MAG: hypothetical protein ACO2O4_02995 [Minisyncoccia bacterium]|jgi:hypothetical protein